MNERDSLLLMIAALAMESGFDLDRPSETAQRILALMKEQQMPLRADEEETIVELLKLIPETLERHSS